jgi:hypothetical protein
MVDVIHDGRHLPAEFLVDRHGGPISPQLVEDHFILERDWGADLIASRLADKLGLDGFHSVSTARCLLDFGRFPGITRKDATHLRRFAINFPFSQLLSFGQKKLLLEDHYDKISRAMDIAIQGKLIKIAVHTYDICNPSGTKRPEVSLVTRALGYQMDSELPYGVFDPLYPDVLAEDTVDRILRDRVSLTLEKSGFPVAHNYPYLLPEGSPEVRHQVWSFFAWMKQHFEVAHPDTADAPEYRLVWEMLMDTNLRSSEASTLRDFLHMYRRPPRGRMREFQRAEKAYGAINAFVRKPESDWVHRYRDSKERPMSLGIEVRKDLVWDFDDNLRPLRPNPERAFAIADKIAEGIGIYLREDRRGGQSRSLFHTLQAHQPINPLVS